MVFRFRTFIVFLVFTGAISFFIACNPSRKAIKAPLKEEGADYLFNKLKEHELKFNWLSAKFSAEYENNGTTFSFSGQIRVRKDSLIWITLTPMLGIEAVRIMISQDSLKMINKLNDTYFIGDYEYLNRFLNTNIDYDILQAFLIGNDFQSYENTKFRASIDRGEYKLSTSERQKLKKFVRNTNENLKVYIQNIWLDSQTFKITFADVRELRRENIKLEATYLEFEDIQGQLFPKKMEFNIRADNNIHVAVEFSKISINTPLQFPFKIPSSYKQIR
ncbi:MAG: DUF4292 domain-containing protein [bacterium]